MTYDSPAPGDAVGETPGSIAGRWRRLFGALIDGLILSCVLGGASSPFYFSVYKDGELKTEEMTSVYSGGAILAIGGFIYYWLLHSYWNGQTLGKKVVGIRVVNQDGSPVEVGAAAIRAAFYEFVPFIPCIGWIAGIVNILWIFGGERKCLHDKLAKTKVVRA